MLGTIEQPGLDLDRPTTLSRGLRDGLRESAARFCLWRASEHVEAVTNGELLDIAELGVELGDGGAGTIVLGDPALAREARAPGPFEYLLLEQLDAAAVESIGLGILLDQRLEIGEAPVEPSVDERRGQMADRDRTDAPLRLHRLARIVDNERIDDGHRAEHGLGMATGPERNRLARQPFERPVGSEMNHGIDALCFA